MPRVLRIHNRLAIGGPVLNAAYLTKYMAQEFQTLLVVGEKEDHEKSARPLMEALGIEYVTIKGMGRAVNPLYDLAAYRQLKGLIREFKPHIVHTHAAKPGALGRLAASAANVPAIVHTFHGHIFHSYFNSLKTQFYIQTERYLAGKSDAIIAISAQQKKELVEEFKIGPEEKFNVIPLGFDLDRFQQGNDQKRAQFRSEFDVGEDEIAIGIIGRLVPVKNHQLFLAAIKHVLDHSRKKIRAFIVGDGESRKQIEEKAKELNIGFVNGNSGVCNSTLVFTSWRSDVDVVNAGLDIICLTSFNEGTPVSLIEAQASDRPIVSTKVGGIADIVVEGQTALLADVKNPEAFFNHLLRLVENDSLRYQMGEGSHEHVMKRFSYQRLVRDMSLLYSKLLSAKCRY